MIYVIATVDLAEGKQASYLKELNKLVPLAISENGCLQYGLAVDVAIGISVQEPINENSVSIIERWTDIDALKVHLKAPHMQSYQKAVKGYVKKVTIRVLEPI